ncbi:MAG: hypothetical protein GOVbin1773_2 [Prokaryotic dsDNA virus sp.]|jgi:hypothetical protein|nr:MAG: hypothetical protein GOVbin1773_2 [Prokaryotic dsDNA virus sp.]|tara:strand:- start:73 stop:315 length:243 start_codon:yes stop_codon:yes gene_type:complete
MKFSYLKSKVERLISAVESAQNMDALRARYMDARVWCLRINRMDDLFDAYDRAADRIVDQNEIATPIAFSIVDGVMVPTK